MHVRVDRDRCDSHGQCMATASEVFEVGDDDVLTVLVDNIPAPLATKVEQAVSTCPKQALSLSAR